MKIESRRWIWTVVGFALLMASRDAFALGSDHPKDSPITGSTNWPKGLERLINTTNRVHGFFVNAADTFFYSGSASELTAFLHDYSQLEGVEMQRLILHDGIGEAKSPWERTGRVCDWSLYACPKSWHSIGVLSKQGTNSVEAVQKATKEPGYIVEVHFWTGGRIALGEVEVPKGVVVLKE